MPQWSNEVTNHPHNINHSGGVGKCLKKNMHTESLLSYLTSLPHWRGWAWLSPSQRWWRSHLHLQTGWSCQLKVHERWPGSPPFSSCSPTLHSSSEWLDSVFNSVFVSSFLLILHILHNIFHMSQLQTEMIPEDHVVLYLLSILLPLSLALLHLAALLLLPFLLLSLTHYREKTKCLFFISSFFI